MFMNYIERDIGRTRIENAFRQCQGQREGKKRHVIRYWTIPLSSGSSAKVQNEGFFFIMVSLIPQGCIQDLIFFKV